MKTAFMSAHTFTGASMHTEEIPVRITQAGQTMEVVVFDKRVDHVTAVNRLIQHTRYMVRVFLCLAFASSSCMARDIELDNRLANVAESGNIAEMEKLIARGADINQSSSLVRATIARKISAVKYLLDHGANPNISFLPVYWAAKNRDREMLRLLLDRGAKIDVQTPGDSSILNTPLITAVYHGEIETAQFLLEFGADGNLVTQRGNTALHQAIRFTNGDAQQFIRLLMQHGADPDIKDSSGLTARQSAYASHRGAQLSELIDQLKPPSKANVKPLNPRFTYSLASIDSSFVEKTMKMTAGVLREAKTSAGVIHLKRGQYVATPGCKHSKQFLKTTSEVEVVISICGIGPYDANAVDEMIAESTSTFPVQGLAALPDNQHSPEVMAMITGLTTRIDHISPTERRAAFMFPIVGHGVVFIPTVVIVDAATDTSAVFQFGKNEVYLNTERIAEIAKQIYGRARQ